MEQFSENRIAGGNKSPSKLAQSSFFSVIAIMMLALAVNGQQMPDFAARVQYRLPALENRVSLPMPDQAQTDKTKDPQTPDATEKKEDKKDTGNPKDALKINMITDGGSASSVNYKPLTNKQRWQFYLAQNFTSVGAYLGVFLNAGLDQLGNDPEEWGQGSSGFAKRVASRFGSNVIQGSIQSSGAWLLKEDPRYIRSDKQGAFARVRHALIFGVLTYNEQGHTTIAIANITSYYAASMISTTWLPGHHNVLSYGLTDGSEQLAFGAAFNLVEEFWPEIIHVLKRK